MEGDKGTGTPSDELKANSAAASDSFSQLWTDVMGMLVSFGGRGDTTTKWLPAKPRLLILNVNTHLANE